MAEYLGGSWKKQDLLSWIGDPQQIAGITRCTLDEGKAAGVQALEVNTGGGLRFTVLPGRGMDIAGAYFQGKSLSFLSPTGITSPAYYEEQGLSWLRSFYAGLLTTCGIANAGAPSVDQGRPFGLHGRVSNARQRGEYLHRPAQSGYRRGNTTGNGPAFQREGASRAHRVEDAPPGFLRHGPGAGNGDTHRQGSPAGGGQIAAVGWTERVQDPNTLRGSCLGRRDGPDRTRSCGIDGGIVEFSMNEIRLQPIGVFHSPFTNPQGAPIRSAAGRVLHMIAVSQ
jgi:hypothetical protein